MCKHTETFNRTTPNDIFRSINLSESKLCGALPLTTRVCSVRSSEQQDHADILVRCTVCGARQKQARLEWRKVN